MAVLGKNVKIYAGGTGSTPIIAMAKNCVISHKCATIEKASSNGTSKEFIPGRDEWEVSIGHLVSGSAPYEGILKVRQIYTLRIDINGTSKTGQAICVQAELNAPVGSLATGSVKFKGSGPLT